MVTGILGAGLALALALLIVIHRRLAALPSEVWWKMKRERDDATPKALDAMKEAVAARVGPALVALRQYEDDIAGSFRAQVADAETRARVGERRAQEVAGVLGEARILLGEVRDVLAAADALGRSRPASLDRLATPTAPPSESPPSAPAVAPAAASGLPSAVPEGEELGDDEKTRVGGRPAGMANVLRACIPPPPGGDAGPSNGNGGAS